jgi:hypothetical protein
MLPLALSACTTAPAPILSASDCTDLIPDDWKTGVPSAPLPAERTVGALAVFGVGQTGQLDIANSRTRDAIEICKRFNARVREVAEKMKPKPWWHLRIW